MPKSTDIGMNRTGMGTSPTHAAAMLEGIDESYAAPAEHLEIASVRMAYAKEAQEVGNVPPPASMKGMASTAMDNLKGVKPNVLVDKLGERLAFERGGVRLYDALLNKFDVHGGWDGGPTRGDLEHHREEEFRHFLLLKDCIDELGADPTAMTPSADLVGVESMGLVNVMTDPKISLAEALHAQLIAELADVAGWELLISLARSAGHDGMVTRFEQAFETEETHAEDVRRWLASSVEGDLKRKPH